MNHPTPTTHPQALIDLALFMADSLAHTDIEAECDTVVSEGQEWFDLDRAGAHEQHPEDRAYTRSMAERADRYLRLRGDQAHGFRVIRHPAFPRLLRFEGVERTCRGCGCTDSAACKGDCWWVEADLCSSCAEPPR